MIFYIKSLNLQIYTTMFSKALILLACVAVAVGKNQLLI